MKGKILFLKNAAVLTIASLLLKTAGMVLRVWLSAHLLGEGLGLYQLIVSVYLLASKPLTAGLEVAVTKVAGEGIRRADKVARGGYLIAVPAALAVGGAVFLFSDFISRFFICDIRAILAVKILTFSLPFMAVSAVAKGYFIARRNTLPHSISQLIEQSVRIGSVVFFVSLWQGAGIDMLCAAVLLGDCIAEAVSCAAIVIWAKLESRKTKSDPAGPGHSVAAVGKMALPVAGERAVTTCFHTVENLMVPTVAAAVMGSREAAVSLFGVLKGMALPLLFFPSSFLTVFSTLLIPEVSEALAKGQRQRLKRSVGATFQIIITLSVLLGALFFFFADHFGTVIYGSREASYMIRVLAPIVPFMYCESIADGMMKGMGKQVRAFWAGTIDAAARLGLVFVLIPTKGMDGFLIIMFLSNILACVYKMNQVMKTAEMKVDIANWIIKPTTAAAVSGIFSSLLCGGMHIANDILYLAAALIITAIAFFALLTLGGTFSIGKILSFLKSGS